MHHHDDNLCRKMMICSKRKFFYHFFSFACCNFMSYPDHISQVNYRDKNDSLKLTPDAYSSI